jgi:transposase
MAGAFPGGNRHRRKPVWRFRKGARRRSAAERLGIGLRTFYDKLKRYGIE